MVFLFLYLISRLGEKALKKGGRKMDPFLSVPKKKKISWGRVLYSYSKLPIYIQKGGALHLSLCIERAMEACSGRKIGDDVIYEIRLDEIGFPDSHHRFGGESIVFPFSIGAY